MLTVIVELALHLCLQYIQNVSKLDSQLNVTIPQPRLHSIARMYGAVREFNIF